MTLLSPTPHPERGEAPAIPESLEFVAVYDAHAAFVWRALVRLGVGAEVVEDVVQEVFIVVHRRLSEFRGQSTVRTWLYGIAVNVARNHYRTQSRRKLLPAARADEEELASLPDVPEAAPDAQVERAEASAFVARLLDELTPPLREVFVLAELEAMTVPEIASVTGTNVNTIYSRLRAARRDFEQALERARARSTRRTR